MTLSTLIIGFAITAAFLTILLKKHITNGAKKTWLFFLQEFVGVWFVFSGFVKAVDPMGTAFKMQQYFAEFEQTFKPTAMKFIAPLFPILAEYTVGFSIFMILLEILLGVALIIGFAPKWTSRIFFILLVFFTVLTGFTYLTGYVPSNKNFFHFSAWGEYEKLQMRVSDCGCFGDFLKLDPKVSFFKDLGLMIPGILFLIFAKSFSQLWKAVLRWGIIIATALVSLAFAWYNTFMNEPIVDFRPFKNGADIVNTRKAELDAAQAVKIENAIATNKKSGEKTTIAYADYLKEFKKYPKEEWNIKFEYGESAMAKTKVSDFLIMDMEGKDITLDLLNYKGYSLMVNAYKVHGDIKSEKLMVIDTTYSDSVYVIKTDTFTKRIIVKMDQIETQQEKFVPSFGEGQILKEKLNPILNYFVDKGINTYAVTGGLGPVQMKDLAEYTGAKYPFYQADDILLKTIARSNPGLILWKDGRIIQKWHHKHLPTREELEALLK